MQKIHLLLKITLVGWLLGSAVNIQAEESSSTDSAAQTYVTPQPQVSRINALKSSLEGVQLEHQIQVLEAEGGPFLSLYRKSQTSSTQGCAILLHSDNEHPDWPEAIAPLRDKLTEYSWCTLSIEVPDITKRGQAIKITSTDSASESTEDSALNLANQAIVFARIEAAIELAKADGVNEFALIGYRTGASYALAFSAQNKLAIQALALIDIQIPADMPSYQIAQLIRETPQPILDYYLSQPSRNQQFAQWRQQAGRQRENPQGQYIQKDAIPDRVTGQDSQALLVQRVRGFLKQNTKQISQRRPLPQVNKGLF